MPPHRIVAADAHRAPKPFRAFAVRSDERAHAWDARAPYDRVHVLGADFLDAGSLASLAAAGYARVPEASFSETHYADTTLAELARAAPAVDDLAARIAAALSETGVLGAQPEPYRRSLETRVDYLGTRGAGFHNDVGRHWSRCLFWLLALDIADAEFVMPHAGVRVALAPGELIVFDPAMAHGLCRPGDAGVAIEESFDAGPATRQMFLTGELPLDDSRWAALGSPWLPVERHDERGALDLMVAEFDERNGTIKRLHALRDGMKRSTCHVDNT